MPRVVCVRIPRTRSRLPQKGMPLLVIDKRERALIKLFQPDQIEVQTLDVGDVFCQYDNGANWIAERKTAEDLAASLKDGRWDEQKDRLLKSGCTVVYIIEGGLRKAKFTYDALVGVCVSTTLRDDVYLHRTSDISETKSVIEHLVAKFQSMVAPPKVLTGITCKRKKRLFGRNDLGASTHVRPDDQRVRRYGNRQAFRNHG